jgi:hypothetical protein
MFKVGDKVRNASSGSIGVVTHIPKERELRDCVVVQFRPCSDGQCILRKLTLVTDNGETKCK